MDRIIIDPHYCSREDYNELLEYLKENYWDFKIETQRPNEHGRINNETKY